MTVYGFYFMEGEAACRNVVRLRSAVPRYLPVAWWNAIRSGLQTEKA